MQQRKGRCPAASGKAARQSLKKETNLKKASETTVCALTTVAPLGGARVGVSEGSEVLWRTFAGVQCLAACSRSAEAQAAKTS